MLQWWFRRIGTMGTLATEADPKILKGRGETINVSAPSSFIANAHNDL